MPARSFLIAGCLVLALAPGLFAQAVPAHFEPLAPFVGKTWKGTFDNGSVDVSVWEWALAGQAVKIRHSVNEGAYGGETFIVWDAEAEQLVYYYFTTAGFYTNGTITVGDDGTFTSYETVTGNEDGITAVRSTSSMLPDGRMRGTSEMLKNGAWVPGGTVTYVEAPDAELVLPSLPPAR